MPEYIDKDKLYNNLTLLAKYQTGDRQQGILGCAITVQLTKPADVVEVVRCVECIHRYGAPGQPNILCAQMHDNDFCSYGERRDDNAAD